MKKITTRSRGPTRLLTGNSLLVLPELLDPEDVQLVSVDVGQEAVRLPERWALGRAPAVSHQINAIACTQNTHQRVTGCPVPSVPGR